MRFTDPLKEMVLQGASTAELKAAAIKRRHADAAHGRHREGPRGRDDAGRESCVTDGGRSEGRRHGRSSSQPPAAAQGDGREGRERPAHHHGLAAAAAHRRRGRAAASSPPLDAGRHQAALLLDPDRRAEDAVRGGHELDFSFGVEGPRALPRATSTCSAAPSPARSASIPFKIIPLRRARPAAGRRRALRASRAASCS